MYNINNGGITTSGRHYSSGVDGGRWSVVRGGRSVGVAGQGERHAKGSAAEIGKTACSVVGQGVESGVVGGQGERSRRGDDVLVPRDEDPSGHDVQTSYRQGVANKDNILFRRYAAHKPYRGGSYALSAKVFFLSN